MNKCQNLHLRMQQEFSEASPLEQTPAENERLKVKHQKRIEAAKQLLREQEQERYRLLEQLNQYNFVVQDDKIFLENTQMIP